MRLSGSRSTVVIKCTEHSFASKYSWGEPQTPLYASTFQFCLGINSDSDPPLHVIVRFQPKVATILNRGHPYMYVDQMWAPHYVVVSL